MEIPRNHQRNSVIASWSRTAWAAILLAFAALTFCVHGYHPLAEDGGLYVAGVEYSLDRSLFPHYSEFVRAHLRYSIFAPLIAGIVHFTHLPLSWVLWFGDIASIALTLVAARQILRRMFPDEDAAQLAGVAFLAAWWTLPVAGTSLMLMDPYVTARSFSMPLSLLAIAFAMDEWSRAQPSAAVKTVVCISIAITMHPLMAGYASCFVLTLRCIRRTNSLATWTQATSILLLLTSAIASFLQWRAPAEMPAARAADITRYYWFLSQWQWYELLGIVAPLIIFAVLLRSTRFNRTREAKTLCQTCLTCGLIASIVALAFAREDLSTHIVARIQVLRVYLLIYALMALMLGTFAALWARGGERPRLRTLGVMCFTASMATIMYHVQRRTFPASPHLEAPWRTSPNPNAWVQAFIWAKANTPKNALFALDAKYINTDGEDAQTFRSTSLRSALPDFSKDGGEAAITPSLAPNWLEGVAAQKGISQLTDVERYARLRPLGVTWMVLHAEAPTTLVCPYINSAVKVCPLQQ